MIVSLFSTPENGILIQDSFPLPEQYQTLLGIEVPYHYFVNKVSKPLNGYICWYFLQEDTFVDIKIKYTSIFMCQWVCLVLILEIKDCSKRPWPLEKKFLLSF